MDHIKLPISKSIANRILLLQAIHGDPLMRVSSDMPDDVIVLHDALEQLREYKKSQITNHKSQIILHLKNCGTALRFLQVHIAKCYPGAPITLTGDPRLMERKGKPTTQTTSARILHGESIPVTPNESPYITMSRRMAEMYQPYMADIEPDWSAAAFWYEFVAIHGGELILEGLKKDSLQGDKIVADIYARHFGVDTTFLPDGVLLKTRALPDKNEVILDFTNTLDLFPPIALTCERLGIELKATGTDRLRFKESDRLEAVRLHEVRNDHRMAMALMAADFPVAESEQSCIAKSYPQFTAQLTVFTSQSRDLPATCPRPDCKVTTPPVTHITPIRGLNDDNLGKKHALSKLIHAASTEYVWLHDDDVVWPNAASYSQFSILNSQFASADLIILPLRMEPILNSQFSILNSQFSILNSLQIAEYAAIQELTMRTAKRGKAVMCSGANLIVRREAWLACEQDLHPEIPSGDDMFLLEAMKKRGYKIAVIDEPDFTAIVRPQTTWRAFFRQRMRWAGKAPNYTDRDIRRCGLIITLANITQILCPPILLVKFPVEYSLIRERMNKNHPASISKLQLFSISLLLEILYPFYLLICLVGGLFRKNEW